MAIRKGDQAAGFKLPAKMGEEVDVGRHIGHDKVVLLFFPFAYSGVCTDEMCQVRDSWDEWSDLDAHVYGISIDSPFVNARFKDELKLPFPLLSDFNRDVVARYGVQHEDVKGLKGVAKRAAFVIDETGRVVYDWVSDNPGTMPDFDKVKEALGTPVRK